MIWRVVAVFTVLFWAVMSGLLLRDVYFPETSRFALIPPRVVIDLFLRQSDAFGSNLHLYHHQEKMGHASFQISRRIEPNKDIVYDILSRGVVEQTMPETETRRVIASWNLTCILADAQRAKQVSISAELPEHDTKVKMAWDENTPAPEVTVKQGDRIIVNSQDVKMLMALGAGKEGAASMLSLLGLGQLKAPGAGANASAKQPQSSQPLPLPEASLLQAREGLMQLAGRERKCYVISLPLVAKQEVRMIFTEAGEIARIDLPDGYVLLEPLIHGLQDGSLPR